jgi:hypothetical protein
MRMIRTMVRGTFAILAVLTAASTASADVRLTIQGGRVTLIAKDATVRQILAEWERVGQTKVINAERIPGGPLNLELINVPEQKALDVLLRLVSGVVLAPRVGPIGNLSSFERIVVMTPSSGPPPSNNLPPAAGQAPFQQPRVADDDQEDRPNPGGPQNRGGPVFAFPQPQVANPQMPNLPPVNPGSQAQQPPLVFPQQAPPPVAPSSVAPAGGPTGTGTMPVGVSVPGMVPAAPAPQPGQPGFPPPPRPQGP